MPADPDRLTRYICFRDLVEDQRKAVAELADEECFSPEYTLFKEGKPASKLYLLDSGRVEILYNIGEGGPARVDTMSEGDILGCSSLIEPYIYTSTARCLTEIETMVLDAAELRKLMLEDCSLGFSIQKQIIHMLLDRTIDLRLES
jgi:CRP/FNR family cyclic AMP-dependent transcriptional regulator